MDRPNSIRTTTDGGYVIAGYTQSNNGDVSGYQGGGDAWIMKLDVDGNLEWQRCLGGTSDDEAYDIQQTVDGGFVVAGRTMSSDGDVSSNHGGYDAWVVKLNTTGDIQWQKTLGGSNGDEMKSIHQTSDGGYITAGSSISNDADVNGNHGSFDAWVIKLNSGGDTLWTKCLGGSGSDNVFSIRQIADDGYIVSGHTSSNDGDVSGNHGSYDAWVLKISVVGVLQWQKCIGGPQFEKVASLFKTIDDNYFVAGMTDSNSGDINGNNGAEDAWVLRLNANGDTLWSKCFGGSNDDVAEAISPTADGACVITGNTQSNDGDVSDNHGGLQGDAWLAKVDENGNLLWQVCLGGSGTDWAVGVQQTIDYGFILTGSTGSNNGDVIGNNGSGDIWVVKLSPDDVGIREEKAGMFSLAPNPTFSNLRVSFERDTQPYYLKIVDAVGSIAFAQWITNGSSPITLDLSDYEHGLYFVKVHFQDGSQSVQRVLKQ